MAAVYRYTHSSRCDGNAVIIQDLLGFIYQLHFFFCFSAVVCVAGYSNAAPTPTPTAATAPTVIPAMPELAAKSYVLMDTASGNILVAHNGDERLPPASLTKLMTAYIATVEMKLPAKNLLSRLGAALL